MAHIVTESKHSLYEYDGQRLVPLPVYQIGPTCVLHAISYGAQMAYRLKMFKLFRKSNLVFNVLHFLYLYEREMMVRMLYDRSRRIKGAFRVIQEFGVEVQDLGVELPGRPHLKLPHFKPFPPTMYTSAGLPIPPLKFDDICRMIQKHEVVIGSFATERIHFNKLREDEIYDFQPQPGSNFDTHCVLFVDYGYHESRPYLKFLNSQGPEFGDAGCGRVYFDRIFQTDDEFCFHTMSFHDDQASCSTSYSDVPPCGLPPATSDSAASQHLESRNVVDSDPSTNRILKMTEEDQILGVVRFVAELIWEDTEPTVSDAEINKVCDDAHRHVLAGQWLDIASLLLKSTDFFSLGVAEEDVEGVLAVTCSLVTKAASEAESMNIAKLICDMLDQQTGYSPSLGLKILFSLHSRIAYSQDKAFIHTKVLQYAAACKASKHIIKDLQNKDGWCTNNAEQRKLFLDVSGVLYDQKE